MKYHCPARWRKVLEFNGLTDFDALWDLELPWIETPNLYRGGWSGVARTELESPEGNALGVYLKKQESYFVRTMRHPVRGISTFCLEAHRIRQLRRWEIPTLELVFFGERETDGKRRALLITEALNGYRSLEALAHVWRSEGWPAPPLRYAVVRAVADLLSTLHRRRIRHGAMYPKHIFVRASEGTVEARLIDLERAKWRPLRSMAALRDLDSLNRHALGWSEADRMRFLLRYLNLEQLSPAAKRLARSIVRKGQRKNSRRPS